MTFILFLTLFFESYHDVMCRFIVWDYGWVSFPHSRLPMLLAFLGLQCCAWLGLLQRTRISTTTSGWNSLGTIRTGCIQERCFLMPGSVWSGFSMFKGNSQQCYSNMVILHNTLSCCRYPEIWAVEGADDTRYAAEDFHLLVTNLLTEAFMKVFVQNQNNHHC